MVLSLHECVDPSPAEPAAAGADYATDSATEPLHSVGDSSAVEPLHSAAGAAPTETS